MHRPASVVDAAPGLPHASTRLAMALRRGVLRAPFAADVTSARDKERFRVVRGGRQAS